MAKEGSVNYLILLILMARQWKPNEWGIKQDAFVVEKPKQMPIRQLERQLWDVMEFNVKARALSSTDDKTVIH